MITLVIPDERYLKSYMEAYDEYQAMGVKTFGLTDAKSCDIFEKFENYRLERNLKPDRVGSDTYWLVDEEKDYFIGEVHVRHRLNDALKLCGGHIGYAVRYSEWNRGYGTLLLRLALDKAREREISEVLVTCDDDNIGSARVMEKNGFVLGDKVEVDGRRIRRYWKSL